MGEDIQSDDNDDQMKNNHQVCESKQQPLSLVEEKHKRQLQQIGAF